jgi:hypothetical protein
VVEPVRGSSSSRLDRTIWRARDALRRSGTLRRVVVAVRHRGLGPADFFVASFPRSGNTWLRFVLADLATGAPVDFEHVERAIPSVGYHREAPALAPGGGRLIKTHEAHRAEYRRGVYLVRDVRDVLVSWYRATRDDPDDLSQLDAVVAGFMTPSASPYGCWTDHVTSWLAAARSSGGIRVFRFEDLRGDPEGTMTEIAALVGLDTSPERVREALARNTAADMARREAENLEFLRRSFGRMSTGVRGGATGRWRDLLTERHLRTLAPALELNSELGYRVD